VGQTQYFEVGQTQYELDSVKDSAKSDPGEVMLEMLRVLNETVSSGGGGGETRSNEKNSESNNATCGGSRALSDFASGREVAEQSLEVDAAGASTATAQSISQSIAADTDEGTTTSCSSSSYHDLDKRRTAFFTPVTFHLNSTWHGLHSLVPIYAMLKDERYFKSSEKIDLYLLNQDHGRDREIWNGILGYNASYFDGTYGWFGNLLEAFPVANVFSAGFPDVNNQQPDIDDDGDHPQNPRSADISASKKFSDKFQSHFGIKNRCYRRIVFGHELMLYTGAGSWVDERRTKIFVKGMLDYFLSDKIVHSKYYSKKAPYLRKNLLSQEIRDAAVAKFKSSTGSPSGGEKVLGSTLSEKKKQEKLLFLVQERQRGKSFYRSVDNMPEVMKKLENTLRGANERHGFARWEIERVDFATIPITEQIRLASRARVFFGAHGDGLSWGLFMPTNSVLMEAVPVRKGGYQVCREGENLNPRGIFGGLAHHFGSNLTHLCFVNPVAQNSQQVSIK